MALIFDRDNKVRPMCMLIDLEMTPVENPTIILDQINSKGGSLEDQPSITGRRDQATSTNRPPRSKCKFVTILVAITVTVSVIVAAVLIGKYLLEYHGRGDTNNKDINECSDGIHVCDMNANCTNTNGSHKCTCRDGYIGDGQSCQDVDECNDGSHVCDFNASCINTIGTYNCTCKEGYSGDGKSCQGINNCSSGGQGCDVNANCTNIDSSHICTCSEGYTGNGQSCQDIDECSETHAVKINNCHANASCINTWGSYNCSCKPNYVGNGSVCEADLCYNYRNLSDADRKSSYVTPNFPVLCDNQLPEGWYRFVGAAGTKMPTKRVPAFRCGTEWSGWLDGAHPTVEDGEVKRMVCFSDRSKGCRDNKIIPVKNCVSYYIYNLLPLSCNMRYCSTD